MLNQVADEQIWKESVRHEVQCRNIWKEDWSHLLDYNYQVSSVYIAFQKIPVLSEWFYLTALFSFLVQIRAKERENTRDQPRV